MQITQSARMLKRHLLRHIEGPKEIRRRYRSLYGMELPDTPRTFTEKLYHRMIAIDRDSNKTYTRLADKFAVRDYVRSKCGEQYLVDLIWSGTDPNKIPFDGLPSKSIIKPNHGTGMKAVLQEPIDRDAVRQSARRWLEVNYYWLTREYQYYSIKPRILIERFLDEGNPHGPLDYRFLCFHGKPELIEVNDPPCTIAPFFDTSWVKLELYFADRLPRPDIAKPDNFDEMMDVASALSRDFDFVRVDLYNVNGRIYFGELTFTPIAGMMKIEPDIWETVLGEKWQLQDI